MKRKNSNGSALVTSVLALLLCVSMLVGTTLAWFTDSAASGSNVITAGNLDIEVQYTLDGTTWNDLDGATGLFQKGLWEPGHTEVVALKIENKGSLALKYAANMNIVSETIGKTKDGADIVLSDILTVSTLTQQAVDADGNANQIGDITLGLAFNGENSVAYQNTTTFKAGNVLGNDVELHPGAAHYLIVKVDMAETVGNEANHNGTDIPSIEFGINVLATQYTYEEDSFGNQYDANADFVVYYDTPGTYTLNASLMATKATDVITVDGEGVILNITGGYYDVGSQDCAVWAKNGGVVNIYDGTFICDGLENTDSANHQDMIYAGANGGKINIYGGFFSSRSDAWLLNERDNDGEIVVYGGTFVNWNPADNVSEGANTNFVEDGISVTEQVQSNGDVWYIVNAKIVDNASSAYTAFKRFDQSGESGTIMLTNGYNTADSESHWNSSREYAFRGEGTDVTLNMNGQTIEHYTSYQNGASTGYTYLFTTAYNGKLTIDGEGTINSANSEGFACIAYAQGPSEIVINSGEFNVDKGIAVWAGNNSVVTINGGSFISTGSDDEELIYSSGGVIYIKGGFFHNTLQENRPVNVANRNRSTGYIYISGGTFVNFDPSTGGDDPSNILVVEGYKVVSETQANGDIWYTVVAE